MARLVATVHNPKSLQSLADRLEVIMGGLREVAELLESNSVESISLDNQSSIDKALLELIKFQTMAKQKTEVEVFQKGYQEEVANLKK
ncbi:MAG TPA: hypothetical protein DDW52_24645 [Planctomycetaceae bacterium]|nr:hypothetical protein [Planctomycetaceae bacterium]